MTWYAPFQSGGGYCSEATSFVHALNAVDFKNFSISQHGDSYNYKYIQWMMENEKELLGSLGISQFSNWNRSTAFIQEGLPSISLYFWPSRVPQPPPSPTSLTLSATSIPHSALVMPSDLDPRDHHLSKIFFIFSHCILITTIIIKNNIKLRKKGQSKANTGYLISIDSARSCRVSKRYNKTTHHLPNLHVYSTIFNLRFCLHHY